MQTPKANITETSLFLTMIYSLVPSTNLSLKNICIYNDRCACISFHCVGMSVILIKIIFSIKVKQLFLCQVLAKIFTQHETKILLLFCCNLRTLNSILRKLIIIYKLCIIHKKAVLIICLFTYKIVYLILLSLLMLWHKNCLTVTMYDRHDNIYSILF